MTSDGDPVTIPTTSLVQGSQVAKTAVTPAGGKSSPSAGNIAAASPAAVPPAAGKPSVSKPAATKAAGSSTDLKAQVALLNKYLNDSGRPDQFRVDPTSDQKLIQEVNPATGEVIAEYPAIAFPALAKSVGISGAVVDDHA